MKEESTERDVVVIGGGPAGSIAATILARDGWRVTLVERERFPRFHIGESLLPFQHDLLERVGLFEKLEARGYVRKHGAHFVSNDGSCETSLDFERFLAPPNDRAWEVERSDFDTVLLRHAAETGAEVLEETRAVDVRFESGGARVSLRSPEGEGRLGARWVVDASGQGTFLARRLSLRRAAPDLKKVALYTHYRGGWRRPGRESGNITLIFGDRCWFWYIPLRDDLVSVGCVFDQVHWTGGSNANAVLEARIATSPYLSRLLSGAERFRPTAVGSDFSYAAERFVGPGWLLAGDAAAFLDPVFSTGVLLAMKSGELGAEAIGRSLRAGGALAPLESYQRKLSSWLRAYFRLIRVFYHPGFPAVFFNPKPRYQRALAPFFGGQVEPGFWQRFHLGMFFRLIHWNHRFGFLEDPRSEEATVHHA